jgi:NAD(P)H-flavin reductase
MSKFTDSTPTNKALFCIKNYGREGGVSTAVHRADDRVEIKGPMGKGLGI